MAHISHSSLDSNISVNLKITDAYCHVKGRNDFNKLGRKSILFDKRVLHILFLCEQLMFVVKTFHITII